MRKYRIPDIEVFAGVINKNCKRCGERKLLVRKETFITGGIHFSIICSSCGKHNFYLSQKDYPELLTLKGSPLLPVKQQIKALKEKSQNQLF